MTIFFIESYVQSVYVKEQYGKKGLFTDLEACTVI